MCLLTYLLTCVCCQSQETAGAPLSAAAAAASDADGGGGGADVKMPESQASRQQRDDSAVMLVGPRPYYTHTERTGGS